MSTAISTPAPTPTATATPIPTATPMPTPSSTPMPTEAAPDHNHVQGRDDRHAECPERWTSYFTRLKPTVAASNAAEGLIFGQFSKLEANPGLLLDDVWGRETIQRAQAYERAAIRQGSVKLDPDTDNTVDMLSGAILEAQLDGVERLIEWIENADADDVAAVEADPRMIVVLTPYFGDLVVVGKDLHMELFETLPVNCFDAMFNAYE